MTMTAKLNRLKSSRGDFLRIKIVEEFDDLTWLELRWPISGSFRSDSDYHIRFIQAIMLSQLNQFCS